MQPEQEIQQKVTELVEKLKSQFHCNKDYRCSTDISQLCKAKDNGWDGLAECLEKSPDCKMSISFGTGGYLCKCPVRIEIAKKYGNLE